MFLSRVSLCKKDSLNISLQGHDTSSNEKRINVSAMIQKLREKIVLR